MSDKRELNAGDIIAIPVFEDTYCIGQYIGCDLFIIFDEVGRLVELLDNIKDVTSKQIVLNFHTNDSKIEDGVWKVLCNLDIPKSFKFPTYKVNTPNDVKVTNHCDKIIGVASEKEILNLKTKKSYSTSVVEKAVRTKFHDGEWHNYVDLLKFKG